MNKYVFKIIITLSFFIVGWFSHLYYSSIYLKNLEKQPSHLLSSSVISKQAKKKNILEKIKEKKQLDVIILNAPTVYYVGSDAQKGFEYDLLVDFAKSINVDLNFTIVHTKQEALELTEKGIADITAASLTVTPERKKEFTFGPYYNSIRQQLVCHNSLYKKKLMPKSIEQLVGLKIMVGKDTSYEVTLNKLKKELDGFDFNTTTELSTEDLLRKVWKQELDCTVVNSHTFMISQRYYPEVVRAMNLTKRVNLAWILRKGDNSLKDALYQWLNGYERSGKMAELNGFYFDFLNIFDYYDTKVFQKKIKTTLPKYERYFKVAGKKYHIPWVILAAQSYQESHWNPKAKSFTGVEGMMMLTNNTAKLIGVKNRLNARESIYGGAKYFAMMQKIFPKEVKGKNLWALTLAAYNIGLGHVYDAQNLAKKLNKNPYSWNDLKTILPLLSQKKYYRNLKYGYARGSEPVRYVDAIQHYYDLIIKSKMAKKLGQNDTNKSCTVIVDINNSNDCNKSEESNVSKLNF